jgi:integrase
MTDMLVTSDYKHLVEEPNRHGRLKLKVRYRGRRKGLMLRPGMEGFDAEYRAALAELRGAHPPSAGALAATGKAEASGRAVYPVSSLGWLIDRYFRESPGYATMKLIGQRRRRAILGDLQKALGNKAMLIPRSAIAAGVTARAGQKAKANEFLKAVKALYSWALDADIVAVNPASGVKKLRVITDGYHTWTVDEIAAFVKRHPRGSMAYLALMIMLFAGLRRSDAVLLGRQHISSGSIRFRTGKTGGELITALPWPLEDAIIAMGPVNRMTLLATSHGMAFRTGASFYNWFKTRCAEAGIGHCTPHGVRKGSSTIADEEGASEDQLNAMFTWVNPNMSATYTKKANRLRLATEGFRKVEDRLVREGILARNGNTCVAPSPRVLQGATKTGS